MDLAIWIHDADLRRLVHSGRAHVMGGVMRQMDPSGRILKSGKLIAIKACKAEPLELSGNRIYEFNNRPAFDLAKLPIKFHAAHT
jgi:hypothetical protein